MPPDSTTTLYDVAQRLLVALLCGALIGLEREFAHQHEERVRFAGVRTMTLIGLSGAVAAYLSMTIGWWVGATAFLTVSALMVTAYFAEAERDPGMTTQVAGLLTFLIGAMIVHGDATLAVAVAIVATLVLSLKTPLHEFARRLSEEDLYATLKFALITFVVLPFLPNRTYGPFDVLNPWEIWLMVVLISGISFSAYVLNKLLGARRGTVVSALLGGLVSSTAVTLAAAQRSREAEKLSTLQASSALLASAVMFPRILVVVAVVQPALLRVVSLPIAVMALVAGATCVPLLRGEQRLRDAPAPEFQNPFALGAALRFGAVFMVILVAAKVAQIFYGGTGLLVTAAISGLADVDAITLSVAKQISGGATMPMAARAIILAALSNTASKAALVLTLGSRSMARQVLLGFGAVLLAGAVGLVLTH
jgi:uncharacterized membrane protein (DUF4010 family)